MHLFSYSAGVGRVGGDVAHGRICVTIAGNNNIALKATLGLRVGLGWGNSPSGTAFFLISVSILVGVGTCQIVQMIDTGILVICSDTIYVQLTAGHRVVRIDRSLDAGA